MSEAPVVAPQSNYNHINHININNNNNSPPTLKRQLQSPRRPPGPCNHSSDQISSNHNDDNNNNEQHVVLCHGGEEGDDDDDDDNDNDNDDLYDDDEEEGDNDDDRYEDDLHNVCRCGDFSSTREKEPRFQRRSLIGQVTSEAQYSAKITAAQGASLVAVNVDTGAPAHILDLSVTARAMFARSVRRRANGYYKRKAKKSKIIWILLTILVFMSLIGAGISIYLPNLMSNAPNASFTYEQWSSLAVVVSFFVVLFFVIKLSLLVRWCFYWLVIAVVVLIIINGGKLAPLAAEPAVEDNTPMSIWIRVFDKNSGPTIAVLIILIVVESATLVATLVQRWLYPRFVSRCSPATAIKWWHIRPVASQPGTFEYKIWDWWSLAHDTRTFSYTGSVNSAGIPHGYGEWCDDANSGELTKGYWCDGIPMAPFKAREFGSGDSFSAVKIGFATSSKLGMDEYNPFPQFDPQGVRYGVASVECSVSGKFFAELPDVAVTIPDMYRAEILAKLAENPEIGSTGKPMDFLLNDMGNKELGIYGNCPSPISGATLAADGSKLPNEMSRKGSFLEKIAGLTRLRRRVTYQSSNDGPSFGALASENLSNLAPPRRVIISVDPVEQVPVVEGFRLVKHLRQDTDSGGYDSVRSTSSDLLKSHNNLKRPLSVVVRAVRTEDGGIGLSVDGHELDPESQGFEYCTPNIARRSCDNAEECGPADEALVFIHGYNCSAVAALKRFGQLLSLGDFPPYIKPFVFAWPPGTALTYFQAIKSETEPTVRDAFVQLIQDLSRSGIRRVHLLSHSAGCRLAVSFAKVFGNLFETIMHDDQFGDHVQARAGVDLGPSVMPTTRLCTFTLINPDVPLDKFLEEDYILIRRYCDLITSYVDQDDGALFWAELFGRQKSLGLHPDLIYTVLAKRRSSDRVIVGQPGSVGRHTKRTIKSVVNDASTKSTLPMNRTSPILPGMCRTDTAAAISDPAPIVNTSETAAAAAASGSVNDAATVGDLEVHAASCPERYLPFRKTADKSRKYRSLKMKLLMRSRFDGISLAGPSTLLPEMSNPGAPSPSIPELRNEVHGRRRMKKREKEKYRLEEEMKELRRLRRFLKEREKYVLEVTDWGTFDVDGRKSAKFLIYPDMDTIDTSLLDVNIHSIRHNYFNLNRLLVDDLLDIIVHKKRANDRTARLSTSIVGGLVYQFLCAPSYVVNP